LCSVEQFVLRCAEPDRARYLSYVLRGRAVLEKARALTNNLQLPRLSSKALLALEIPIIRPDNMERTLQMLDKLNTDLVRAWELARRSEMLASSIWPATLNAAFNSQL
jgi:type I restriction enzyme, S subunit